MKVVSQDALTKLIQLSKDNFIDKNDTVQATTVQLATVATTGDYDDLTNKPEEIPAQSGQSGKFLTTNGTSVSWATVNALPSQTSQSGKFLTTNGTSASWASIPTEIPTQSGQSGKFLTTNGTTVSWGNVPTYAAGFGLEENNNEFSIRQISGNYIVQGTLTDNDGIISGFSSSNYITIISVFPNTATTSNITIRAKMTNLNGWQTLFSKMASGQYLITTNGGKPQFYGYNGASTLVSTVLTANTWYWFSIDDDGTTASYYVLQDNNYTLDTLPAFSSWTKYATVSHSNYMAVMSDATLVVGKNHGNGSEIWSGSFDFNNARIKVNNEVYWIPEEADVSNVAVATPYKYGFVRPDNRTIVVNQGVISYNNVNGYITASSPALSGTPTAPTATAGTSTTQIATTEFVQTAISGFEPLPSQTGNNGKFLTTNGSAASWASLPTVDQTYSGTSTNAQSGVAVKSAIDSAISSVYKAAGSVAFANLPTLSSSIEGYVYNVTDSFTTTADFVEGVGHTYPAGTNIVCINTSSLSLFAWYLSSKNITFYTLTATPSVGDVIYDNTGTATNISVLSVASDYSYMEDDKWAGHNLRDASKDITAYKWDVLAGFVDLSGYQPLLVSGTNIKTVNGTSVLGSGNISVDSLPSQTGQSGKFLTTNGTTASWAESSSSTITYWVDD